MRKLVVFNSVSLDGYFTDANNDVSWAHKNDPEWNEFVAGNASGSGELLFGRVTYDMMVSFWPTEEARKMMPEVAEGMNNLPKVVFSRKMDQPTWNNTRLVKDNIEGEVRRMKSEDGDDMTILGSGSIVAQLAQAGLIDVYQIIVNPIVLGSGRSMFDGVDKLNLTLTNSRTFKNGNVLLNYERGNGR
jgi:dihydrofolate reductase